MNNNCTDCGQKLDGQNCSAGGVHKTPMKTLNDKLVAVEKKFDKVRGINWTKGGLITTDLDGSWELDEKAVKSFYRSHILAIVESAFEECLPKRKGIIGERAKYADFYNGYNSAISEIKSNLTTYLKVDKHGMIT